VSAQERRPTGERTGHQDRHKLPCCSRSGAAHMLPLDAAARRLYRARHRGSCLRWRRHSVNFLPASRRLPSATRHFGLGAYGAGTCNRQVPRPSNATVLIAACCSRHCRRGPGRADCAPPVVYFAMVTIVSGGLHYLAFQWSSVTEARSACALARVSRSTRCLHDRYPRNTNPSTISCWSASRSRSRHGLHPALAVRTQPYHPRAIARTRTVSRFLGIAVERILDRVTLSCLFMGFAARSMHW